MITINEQIIILYIIEILVKQTDCVDEMKLNINHQIRIIYYTLLMGCVN